MNTYESYTITVYVGKDDEGDDKFAFYRCFDSQKEAKQIFKSLSTFYTGDYVALTVEKDLIDKKSKSVIGSIKLARFEMLNEEQDREDLDALNWDIDVITYETKRRSKNTDVHLSEVFGVPTRTLQDWKKSPEGSWRKKVYNYLNDTWM